MWTRASGVGTVTVIYDGEVCEPTGLRYKEQHVGCILSYRQLAGNRDHDITSVAMEMPRTSSIALSSLPRGCSGAGWYHDPHCGTTKAPHLGPSLPYMCTHFLTFAQASRYRGRPQTGGPSPSCARSAPRALERDI